MMYADVVCGSLGAGELVIDAREFQRRIGAKCSLDSQEVVKCRTELEAALDCRYAYVRLDLSFPEAGVCDLGFTKIKSSDLYKNLNGCSCAYMMAVTLGIGADRLMHRLKIKSTGELFITDALASAAAEALCDYADREIREREMRRNGKVWRPRYSPGYGDCGIENQKKLIERLNGEKYLGITLNESFFMTPSKSITAIMGIKYEKDN